jgi:uncharacterized protein with NRDE domain
MAVMRDVQVRRFAQHRRLLYPRFHCFCSLLLTEVHAVGNSSVHKPWRKVSEGRDRFANIARSHKSTAQKDQLKTQLFDLMSDKTG